MIEEVVRVVGVEDDAIWVEAERRSTCGRCALRSGCGHGLLESWRRGPLIHLRLPRPAAGQAGPQELSEGEQVVLGLEEAVLLGASLRLYGLPLAGFVAGAAVGDAVAGDALALALGVLGAATLLAVARLRRSEGEIPRILRRTERTEGLESAQPVTIV